MIWPDVDHPILNQIRDIRAAAGDRQLLACLNLSGEPKVFRNRDVTLDEIRWMTYAAIGGNFHGVVWRNNAKSAGIRRGLRHLEAMILRYSVELVRDEPVTWVQISGDVFASAL